MFYASDSVSEGLAAVSRCNFHGGDQQKVGVCVLENLVVYSNNWEYIEAIKVIIFISLNIY